MNNPVFQFFRTLAQQLLALMLGLILMFTVLFTLHDSGEGLMVQTVSTTPSSATETSGIEIHFEVHPDAVRLGVRIGARASFSYQRKLLDA